MKHLLILALFFTAIISAYFMAQSKIQKPVDLYALKFGMSESQLREHFGAPSDQNRNVLTYILEDSSRLTVTLRDGLVTNAKVTFHSIVKIEDPQMKKLSLVQMDPDTFSADRPSWFFAGKPEEGLIYKITSDGVIESLTWIRPFSYDNHQPKQLSAILRDFQSQHALNM